MSTSRSTSLATHPLTSLSKADRLWLAYRKGYTPPPRISVPQWADTYRRLAKGAGSTSGNWRTSTVEVGRGPALAVTEPGVHIITVMVSTQLLKTALLENIFGFHAHLDPCPMLLLQPKEDAAEQFSKERITPLIRATPVLRDVIFGGRSRRADETLLYKPFSGGFLALAGAGSPDNLARRPVRLVLADEINKYPITREGDPLMIADERTASYGTNWLSVRACSPTVEDECRISDSYADSDQRRASVPCPHCGHRQFLDFFKHVEWDKDGSTHNTKSARIFCEACGCMWSEGERLRALQAIRWHQTKPFTCCGQRHVPLDEYEEAWKGDGSSAIDLIWKWWESDRHAVYRVICPSCGTFAVDNTHAGFQASKLYSPWAKDKPSDIARKWVLAKDDEDKKQVFWNTQLGLPYRRHSGREIQIESLAARAERWAGDVPEFAAILTGGIDVQDYRVEIEIVAWGKNEESWSITYHVIDGEFSDKRVQDQLDEFLKRTWSRADGRQFEIMAACIDSGGHHTQAVYDFCKARIGRRIWAVKGESARGGKRSPVWPTARPSNRNKKSYRPVIIGVNAAKDTISSRLGKTKPGPGYMHFPVDRDLNYYAQLTAERSVLVTKGGQKYRVWELRPGRANEALDCRVYNYAALCGLLHFGLALNKRAEEVQLTMGPPLELAADGSQGHPPTPKPVQKRRSRVGRMA
ncbi:phage terminase large subunit family protein [Luteibacter aegosomatis]|uniref:phage terminase large subunit family protein n=1 Tax=Luteibacter aegosomatis TaxID=2911537 RepID=UPI001FF91773|nr:terminase gpA endonuclease subunit [Luteibacter aegosomatis]UPG86845.1 phage terminase large subunit family protein [Luteibacter aegosomatis]